MMSNKLVTVAQGNESRNKANKKKVPREVFQQGLNDGSFNKYLDEILARYENTRVVKLSATVKQNRSYFEALEAACPDTPSHSDVYRVGDLYLPVSNQEEKVNFVLRNFPKGGGSWDKAFAWAESNGHKITNPREAFAVREQHDLRKLLQHNCIYLVATMECTFEGYRQAVYVGVDELYRDADLGRLVHFGDVNVWFLFRE